MAKISTFLLMTADTVDTVDNSNIFTNKIMGEGISHIMQIVPVKIITIPTNPELKLFLNIFICDDPNLKNHIYTNMALRRDKWLYQHDCTR